MYLNRRKSWMWAEACALLDEAERKHRHFFELLGVPAARPVWEAPADIFADGSELEVMVAFPGARAHEVPFQITPAGVQIETTVPPPSLNTRMTVVRLEIPYGRMRRRLDLPPAHYALVARRLVCGYRFS